MPEGPEIRRAADALDTALANQTITSAVFTIPSLKHVGKQLIGQKVRAVTCHGKAMLTHFSNGTSMYSHNQLYGVWKITKGNKMPSTKRVLRVKLQTETHCALLYSATDIEIWKTDELTEHPFLKKLGPDILDTSLTAESIAERLNSDRFSRRSLASLYLDQGFIAGIGNYLRSEILFAANLHPLRKPSELSSRERQKLARQSIAVSERSYRTGGITVSKAKSKHLEKKGGGFETYRFAVFNRESEPCITCGASIEKKDINARRIYWCPSCQSPTS